MKQWSTEYTKNYGKGYSVSNLMRFRQFYLEFPILAPVAQVSWTNITLLLPIKDINKRNYYINLCINKNLSYRQLMQEIKNNSYERLMNKPEHIEIIAPKNKYSIIQNMKNPIIIKINSDIKCEKDLEMTIISELTFFFEQLGEGFTFVGNQYKLLEDNKNYYLDLLLLNYKLNCFVVVELKLRELKKEDKAQIEFYMELVDEQVKEPYQNKTIGIIISKENNEYVANFVRSDGVIALTYEIINNDG